MPDPRQLDSPAAASCRGPSPALLRFPLSRPEPPLAGPEILWVTLCPSCKFLSCLSSGHLTTLKVLSLNLSLHLAAMFWKPSSCFYFSWGEGKRQSESHLWLLFGGGAHSTRSPRKAFRVHHGQPKLNGFYTLGEIWGFFPLVMDVQLKQIVLNLCHSIPIWGFGERMHEEGNNLPDDKIH